MYPKPFLCISFYIIIKNRIENTVICKMQINESVKNIFLYFVLLRSAKIKNRIKSPSGIIPKMNMSKKPEISIVVLSSNKGRVSGEFPKAKSNVESDSSSVIS